MRKIRIALIVPALVVLGMWFCFSAAAQTEGIYTYSVTNEHAVITEIAPKSADEIVIPDTLGGYPVTELRVNLMMRSTPFVVENIVIPAGLETISFRAFAVANLARITVADGNPAYASEDGVLYDKALTTLIKCPLYYPKESLTVPDTVTEIGAEAFSNAKYLKTVVLQPGVVKLSDQAFAFTSSLKNVILPDTVTTVEENCFGYNTAIERIVLPESVTEIGMSAFTDCTSLETAVILGDVSVLRAYAFDNTALKTVVLPSSLTSVSANTFVRTEGLERILFAGTRVQWDAVSVGESNGSFTSAQVICDFPAAAYKDITVSEADGILTLGGSGACPDAQTPTYHYWDDYASTAEVLYVDGNITGIGENAFVGFSQLSLVIVQAENVTVTDGAFRDCGALENVIFLGGGALTANAFADCGPEVNVFAPSDAGLRFTGGADTVNYIPVSYADGILRYEAPVTQNAYDFFDILSVFCGHFGTVDKLTVSEFTFEDIPIYYYDPASGERRRITEPLTAGEIYPQLETDDGTQAISFNALCDGIRDQTIRSFFLVINDEKHPETQDTRINVIDRIVSVIKGVLRTIVTLLNKLFRLIKGIRV